VQKRTFLLSFIKQHSDPENKNRYYPYFFIYGVKKKNAKAAKRAKTAKKAKTPNKTCLKTCICLAALRALRRDITH